VPVIAFATDSHRQSTVDGFTFGDDQNLRYPSKRRNRRQTLGFQSEFLLDDEEKGVRVCRDKKTGVWIEIKFSYEERLGHPTSAFGGGATAVKNNVC